MHALDADVRVLPGVRRVRSADDFVLAGLVHDAVADLELHRKDALLGGLFRSRFFSGRGLAIRAKFPGAS
jgi:hypothetical protein